MEIIIDLNHINDPATLSHFMHTLELMEISYVISGKAGTAQSALDDLDDKPMEYDRAEFASRTDLETK
ncbi:MAG: hypothetical protein H7Y03_03155 [Chitinophagaceae bacterium]|nr:hypothetical protein [Chitinophagaceae bacterium]